MSKMSEGVSPCNGCPFLRANQGKRTDGGYYTIKNIRRLWAGIRNGTDGKLMICHATDPNACMTGSPANPKPGQIKAGNERACVGALFMYKREEKLLNEAGGLKQYMKHPRAAKPPMTRFGFAAVINAVMFGWMGKKIEMLQPDMTADVGLPWESKEDGDVKQAG